MRRVLILRQVRPPSRAAYNLWRGFDKPSLRKIRLMAREMALEQIIQKAKQRRAQRQEGQAA